MAVPFWMVWRDGGGAPTAKHGTRETATAEAERLARAVPGAIFYVLAAVESVRRTDLDRIVYLSENDMVPF